MLIKFVVLFSCLFSCSLTDQVTNEFVILLLSQPHIYILSQVHNASTYIPSYIPLLYTHSYATNHPNWYTIYPLFPTIVQQYPQMKWLFICEAQTRFNLTELIQFSQETNDSYVGHALYDSEPSIIHHYSLELDKPYPDFATGVLISSNVLKLFNEKYQTYKNEIDFIIDIKYELNQLINQLTQTKFIDRSDRFCYEHRTNCLTWSENEKDYSCSRKDIYLEDLYFGIKTFVNNHQTRISLLKKTWLTNQLNYHLFTNQFDDKFEHLIVNKENTERGHCHKTFSILNHFAQYEENRKYLIIADDDTLLSVPRLIRLIRCFMLTNNLPLVLGERYGYGTYYTYPTGGSGMIFNRQSVQQILANCECPSSDTPDDMFLGLCLHRLQIPLIHIKELHQAQVNAYSSAWLQQQNAISFHKFENINVEQIYRDYLDEPITNDLIYHYAKDEL